MSVQAEKSDPLHLVRECVGILAAMLHRTRYRDHIAIDEIADGAQDQPLLFTLLLFWDMSHPPILAFGRY